MVYAYTQTESRKPPLPKQHMPSLFDEPTTWQNWHKHVNWPQSILLLSTPLIALYGLFTTQLQTKTLIWAVIYYFITGLGITAGYHRMWAHRAYRGTLPLRLALCLAGSGAVEGSAYWWSRGHRAHHRWTDTDKDPYSAQRGFFFSHLGWMLVQRPKNRIGYADVADLKADPVLAFQHKHYVWFALIMGFIVPTLVAGLGWGDFRGGYFYAAVARLVFVHHATFCVNSLAHFLGEDTFDDHHTPRDHWITALATLGEGYHNFHHEFPQDYRNAIVFHQYDPTKWLIKTLSFVGLAYDLKTFPSNEVNKGRIQMQEKKILAEKRKLAYGTPIEDLPIYTWDEYQSLVLNDNKKWILLEGILYDVEDFMHEHPGGVKYLSTALGKDMTTAFNGGIYNHSNGARNLLTTLRVGVLKNGMQVMTQEQAAADYDDSLEYSEKAALFAKNK
ncbi:stearoyl-CoA desaturase [Radiomyces spectabilis]|uniref:stearoyl-CoA desaturase n=1 Tax=Radiomyces spectabilis TaxID=64574 RepID=UPI002220DF4E|nr:stearoyl-CoA desaturase [Radiomyces spectabilis]KAI8379746.1 stearoyl-CoA desaturase [Radiomyces spectabilis]